MRPYHAQVCRFHAFEPHFVTPSSIQLGRVGTGYAAARPWTYTMATTAPISSRDAQAHRSRTTARSTAITGGLFLGLGLGGFIDGIFLHQIAQWHNMGSAILPPTTMDAMSQNMRW